MITISKIYCIDDQKIVTGISRHRLWRSRNYHRTSLPDNHRNAGQALQLCFRKCYKQSVQPFPKEDWNPKRSGQAASAIETHGENWNTEHDWIR